MEFRGLYLLVVCGAAICCVQSMPTPRDSTVVKIQEVTRNEDSSLLAPSKRNNNIQVTTDESHVPDNIPALTERSEIFIPKQVSCQYEEATEDLVCQMHCLPKGYSYGLCVRNKCSCI